MSPILKALANIGKYPLKAVGSLPGAMYFAGDTIADRLEEGKSIPDAVIDKEVGNPIGVGEATVLTFPSFLRQCGINLPQWFQNVDGTYKAGIDFPNWVEPGRKIYHPFF